MKKTLIFIDIFSITGLLIYNLAMLFGILRFGREMGDMGYNLILTSGTITALILFFLKYKGVSLKGTFLITLFASGLLLFIFYNSSYGRGPDFPWDGRFFDLKHENH